MERILCQNGGTKIEILNMVCEQSSKQGGFHPLLLTEPYVNGSIHTALQDASTN